MFLLAKAASISTNYQKLIRAVIIIPRNWDDDEKLIHGQVIFALSILLELPLSSMHAREGERGGRGREGVRRREGERANKFRRQPQMLHPCQRGRGTPPGPAHPGTPSPHFCSPVFWICCCHWDLFRSFWMKNFFSSSLRSFRFYRRT